MELYLVRHAIAHERDGARWPDDARRPLTSEGRHKFREAARGLKRWLPRNAVVLSSPFDRARETAAILTQIAKLPRAVECPEIASGAPVGKAFELLRSRPEDVVVLVGHEPNLSTLLAAALGGDRQRFSMEFKKGGAACIRFEKTVRAGGATLVWMIPPRILRALK
jgi:phosphohistidine phosphatase